MYDWLPYWLFGVVCILFGFWLRGLFENVALDPNESSSGASEDAIESDPLDDYDLMREKWQALRDHADVTQAHESGTFWRE